MKNQNIKKELKNKTKVELVSLMSWINKRFKSVEFQNYEACSGCTKKILVDCLCNNFTYEDDGTYDTETLSTIDGKPLKRIINVAKNIEHVKLL